MDKFIVAVATDDGKTFTNSHFGDAKKFLIYELTPQSVTFLKEVENTVEKEGFHEEHHGDPKKAKGIGQFMKRHGVNVLVGKVFGPNIVRMTPQFVIVLMNNPTIDQAMEELKQHWDEIVENWQQGENRKHLNFKHL